MKKSLYILPFISCLYGISHLNDDLYYFMLGFKRGLYSVTTGAQIIKGVNEATHEYAAKKLYSLFKRNSGTYIKLGQSLSQNEHVLPEPFTRNLEPLCQEAPQTDLTKVKSMIEKQLNVSFDDFFESFEEVPLGSASLAQVHKAKLKSTGEVVAIKVQHPMVSIYCPSDVAIVKFATKVGELIWPGVKLQWIAKEFQHNIMKEIDFTNEALNADKIRNFFHDDDRIVIPKIFWQYTTKKIIMMSYEKGKSIVDTQFRQDNNISVHEVAELLANAFNRQIFEFGFVHSDPHHGNLFIRKEQNKLQLVLLDHGLYRELDNDFKHHYALLWRGVFMQEPEIIKEACQGLNVNNPEMFIAIVTNKSYQNIMKEELKYSTSTRLGQTKKSEEEALRIKKFIHDNITTLTHTLHEMRSEMILVLKINGFLRSIDKRIGNPINNFNIMIDYVYKELMSDCRSKGRERTEKLALYYEYYSFKFIILFLNLYYWLFSKKNKIEMEKVDLNILV